MRGQTPSDPETPDNPNRPEEDFSLSAVLDRKRIRRGIAAFLILSAVGLTALFLYTNSKETLGALGRIRPLYLALTALLSVVDMWLGGLRNHVFIGAIRPGIGYWTSFRANLSNVFMGAVTPSQTGGSPAQVFVYYRKGLSVGQGMSIIVVNYLSTLIFFITAAAFAMTVIHARSHEQAILYMIRIAFAIFISQLVLFLLFLWRPHLVEKVLRFIADRIAPRLPLAGKWVARMVRKLIGEIEPFHRSCTLFLREKPSIFLKSLLLTTVLYTNKFTIAFLIMLGLGLTGNYLEVLAIQALVLFILYFAPTPGGSGIAEISTGALMATMVPTALLPIFTALQRFFFLYVPAITGSVIFTHEIGRYAKEGIDGDTDAES